MKNTLDVMSRIQIFFKKINNFAVKNCCLQKRVFYFYLKALLEWRGEAGGEQKKKYLYGHYTLTYTLKRVTNNDGKVKKGTCTYFVSPFQAPRSLKYNIH